MSRLIVAISLFMASTLSGSGPYSPVRVPTRQSSTATAAPQDELYGAGKAVYLGAVKVGSGHTCSSCHSGASSLNRVRLAKVMADLPARVEACVKSSDRVNGALQGNQLDALVHYLTKRFRL